MGRGNGFILGRYEVLMKDLWSYHFNMPFLDIPYIGMAFQELRERPQLEESKYYQYLAERHENSLVFRRLTPEDRFIEWRELGELTEYPDEENVWREYNGKPLLYGSPTALYDGERIRLVDGHHRLSFMVARGETVSNIYLFTND